MQLEKHTWKTLRTCIKQAHPKLCTLIDEISPTDSFPLYLARYPYGTLILDKGIFQVINNSNQLVPLAHSSIPNAIKEDLGYTETMPMGLISHNSIETFFLNKNRTIPASLFGEGGIISLWRVLEEDNSYQVGSLWNVTSGARKICVLPKITDKACYHKLKAKYGLKLPIPASLNDHWYIFNALANSKSFSQEWYSEIIFFSKEWFKYKHDKQWAEIYKFLLNDVWQSSSFRRNQFIFDFAFSLAQENKNLRPNPYLADTSRHLVAIGTGVIPAFAIATDDSAAPISGLQKLLIEDYGLKKKYGPVFMHLHHFSLDEDRPVYYSLEMPTTTIFSPRSIRVASKMSDMRELKHIMETLFSEIIKGNLGVEKTPLFKLSQDVNYNFFHSERDFLNEISLATELSNIDSGFSKIIIDQKNYAFPEFSPFFRGCISISKAK